MRLTAALMSLTLLTGCGGVADLFWFLGGSRTETIVKIECPQLATIPDSAVDALQDASAAHPEIRRWAGDLNKHYDKLDTCKST